MFIVFLFQKGGVAAFTEGMFGQYRTKDRTV
jgi:hypothetical protein